MCETCPFVGAFKEDPEGAAEFDRVKLFYGNFSNLNRLVYMNTTDESRRQCIQHLKKEALYRLDHPLGGMSRLTEELHAKVEALSMEVRDLHVELQEYKVAQKKKRKHEPAEAEEEETVDDLPPPKKRKYAPAEVGAVDDLPLPPCVTNYESTEIPDNDDCFPASNFSSCLGSIQSGELHSIAGWTRVTDDGVQTRAHLETQLASSLALGSPNEFRHCLLSLVRFLAREADESRLREVCETFLGPPTGMVEETSSNSKNLVWDPFVLGMKKHKLLREAILPSMASNRKVQRLLNEFMGLLSEYEIVDANQEEQANPTTLNSSSPATNPIESSSLATDQEHTAPPKLDHNTPLKKEQTNIPPALTNEAIVDTPMMDQPNQDDAQVKENA